MDLLENLIRLLTEAPMSDEDKKDSEILRTIFTNRSNRKNAKITPEQQAVLDKYGLTMDSQALRDQQGKYIDDVDSLMRLGTTRGHSSPRGWVQPKWNNDKVNYADLARKRPERKYAQDVNSAWAFDQNEMAGYGDDQGRTYFTPMSFQAKSRVLNTINDPYYQDYKNMQYATSSRDDANKRLARYDKDMDAIEARYQRDLDTAKKSRESSIDSLNRDNEYELRRRASATKSISAIKDKYRKTESMRMKRASKMNEDFSEDSFEIYWDDLTPECQSRLFDFLGGENGNYDVFPIATIESSDF